MDVLKATWHFAWLPYVIWIFNFNTPQISLRENIVWSSKLSEINTDLPISRNLQICTNVHIYLKKIKKNFHLQYVVGCLRTIIIQHTFPVSFSSWYCLRCFPWQSSYVQYVSIWKWTSIKLFWWHTKSEICSAYYMNLHIHDVLS